MNSRKYLSLQTVTDLNIQKYSKSRQPSVTPKVQSFARAPSVKLKSLKESTPISLAELRPREGFKKVELKASLNLTKNKTLVNPKPYSKKVTVESLKNFGTNQSFSQDFTKLNTVKPNGIKSSFNSTIKSSSKIQNGVTSLKHQQNGCPQLH